MTFLEAVGAATLAFWSGYFVMALAMRFVRFPLFRKAEPCDVCGAVKCEAKTKADPTCRAVPVDLRPYFREVPR